MNNVKYEEIIKDRKLIEGSKLIIDKVYEAERPLTHTFKDEMLSKIMGVKNQGGIRPIGSVEQLKYVVLFTTGDDPYWQDSLDEELGMFVYYGDNKTPGNELHETNIRGNKILKEAFLNVHAGSEEGRKKCPPFFLFSTAGGRDVKFLGLLVPGYESIPQKEWLVALWAKRSEGGRFQNYKSIFTVLDIFEGSTASSNEASIDLRWLEDLKDENGYDSIYAPVVWKKWVDTGKYKPLVTKGENRVRSKIEQLPDSKLKMAMLSEIHAHFSKNRKGSDKFEEFAIYISTIADGNIHSCDHTRPSRDGGRDAVGSYRILGNTQAPVTTFFALEAKCYQTNSSVGVKETSRLISRIKNREFGIMVTTSYIGLQAYEEIVADNHPIIIISGGDIINLLWMVGITDLNRLKDLLINQYSFDNE